MKKRLLTFLVKEWFLLLALLGFAVSLFITRRAPHFEESDFRVVFVLFVFLLVAAGLEKTNFLRFLAERIERGRFVELKMVLTTFFLAAVITNDVALITVVPLTLKLRGVDKAKLVALETLAANGGSMLTPVGNPQNIFIYHHYGVNLPDFFETVLPYGVLFLFLLILFTPKRGGPVQTPVQTKRVDWRNAAAFLIFFFLFIPAALRLLPLWVGLAPVLYALFFFRRALAGVDYFLLLTFLVFFAFTDEVSSLINIHLKGDIEVFVSSALLSQLISNVPAALLLADFTELWKPLLIGVNVGGFGTPVASLANLIAYKLYTAGEKESRRFFKLLLAGGLFFFTAGVGLFLLQHLANFPAGK